MRTLIGVVLVLVVGGTAALYYGLTRGRLDEWQPGRLPYPMDRAAFSRTFRLYRGGRFALDVRSPNTAGQKAMLDDTVATGLRVVLTGPNGFHLDKVLTSMSVRSGSALERIFSSNDLWVLQPGKYELRIEGRDPVPTVFRERGGVVYLERMEPVGPDLGIELSEFVGYVLLGSAILLTIWLGVRRTKK